MWSFTLPRRRRPCDCTTATPASKSAPDTMLPGGARRAPTPGVPRSPSARLAMRLTSLARAVDPSDREHPPAYASPVVGRPASSAATKSYIPPRRGSFRESISKRTRLTKSTQQMRLHNSEHMAVVQTLHNMTLGGQNNNNNKMMYNVIQHNSSPQSQTNCVIVSTGIASNQANKSSSVIHQGKRPLAPAPERTTSVLVTNNADLRCKRKIQFMPYGGPPQQPASVARRNARERNRVKQVNNGFATLRQHIPSTVAAAFAPQGTGSGGSSSGRGASKKLSKVETLRLAVEYIRSLQQMIEDHESDPMGNNPMSTENTLMDSRYYPSSPDSLTQQFSSYPLILPTPTCSEASASPTPSHSSEGSVSATSTYTPTTIYHHQDNYENYDPKNPEDEELLDAIFLWQQNE